MWRSDPHGTPLDDDDAAREELRRRAWLAISEGLRRGCDVRQQRVRVTDEYGGIVFEGTLAEAVANDAGDFVPSVFQHGQATAMASKRIRLEAATNRQALLRARLRLADAVTSLRTELRIAEQLIEASRRYTAPS